jgi:bile acid-coenzyme A ligase
LTFISGDQYLAHPGSVGVVAGEMSALDEAGKARRSAVRDDIIARRRAPASH